MGNERSLLDGLVWPRKDGDWCYRDLRDLVTMRRVQLHRTQQFCNFEQRSSMSCQLFLFHSDLLTIIRGATTNETHYEDPLFCLLIKMFSLVN